MTAACPNRLSDDADQRGCGDCRLAGSRGGAVLDGDIERRLPAAKRRVPIRQESGKRGDFESEVLGGGGGEPGVLHIKCRTPEHIDILCSISRPSALVTNTEWRREKKAPSEQHCP